MTHDTREAIKQALLNSPLHAWAIKGMGRRLDELHSTAFETTVCEVETAIIQAQPSWKERSRAMGLEYNEATRAR